MRGDRAAVRGGGNAAPARGLESPGSGLELFTIGHSTRSFDEFATLLRANRIELLADIRTVPGSRRMPHFSKAALQDALPRIGIAYVHLPGLGGLRKPRRDSPNDAWRNASFRGYADHMSSRDFETELQRLVELAAEKRTAIMCAEAVPWRCHRSLVSDALLVRGVDVRHIIGSGSPQPHSLTQFARVDGTSITYPAPETLRMTQVE